jgi:hypothetical protein
MVEKFAGPKFGRTKPQTHTRNGLMKANQLITLIAALGLTFGAALSARATADTNRISFALTFFGQGATTTVSNASNGSTTYNSTVLQQRSGDKDLLGLIADSTGATIPPGSFVEVDGSIFQNGLIFVVKSKTNSVIVDVSNMFDITVTSDDIYAGKYNDTTWAETSKDYYTVHIKFDDKNGSSFDVEGFATESYKASPQTGGVQTLTDSISMAVSGTALSDGFPLIVKGTVTLKGKSISN